MRAGNFALERVTVVDFDPLCRARVWFEQQDRKASRAIECARIHAARRAHALIMCFVRVSAEEIVDVFVEKEVDRFRKMTVRDADAFVTTLDDTNGMLRFDAEKIRVSTERLFVITVAEDDSRLKSHKHVKDLFAPDITKMHELRRTSTCECSDSGACSLPTAVRI